MVSEHAPVSNLNGLLESAEAVLTGADVVADLRWALFDREYYEAQRPDVVAAGLNPFNHYIETGWREGSSPHRLFDPQLYGRQRPDVVAKDTEPFEHYLIHGWRENTSPSLLFDPVFYLGQQPDLAERGVEPLGHFLTEGWREGLQPHPLFDVRYYAVQRPDVVKSGLNPLLHYLRYGWREGTHPHPLFDPAFYLSQQPGLAECGIEPLGHFLSEGWRERIQPHPLFDARHYAVQRPDVVDAGENPLLHYLRCGWREGTPPHLLFHSAYYEAQIVGLADEIPPLIHYLTGGWREPHLPHPLFDPNYYRTMLGRALTRPDLVDYLGGGHQTAGTTPLIDHVWYRNTYLGGDASKPVLVEYLDSGWRWGHTPHPLFDVVAYRATVPDAIGPELIHYVLHGEIGGKRPNAMFSAAYYRGHHPVARGTALEYFIRKGDEEGHDASPQFRGRRYQSRYLSYRSDRRALRHYMFDGRWKNFSVPQRSGKGMFDAAAELALRNKDGSGADIRPVVVVLWDWVDGPMLRQQLTELGGASNDETPVDAANEYLVWQVTDGMALSSHVASMSDWARPVLILDAGTLMSRADINRLVDALANDAAVRIVHPMVLDRNLDVHHAGYSVGRFQLTPRGVGGDPHHPSLFCNRDGLVTAGPALALRMGDVEHTLRDPAMRAVELGELALRTAGRVAAEGGISRYLPLAVAILTKARSLTPLRNSGVLLRPKRPTMLFIDSEVPKEGRDAGSHYALQLMEMFKEFGYDVTFIADAEMRAGDDAAAAMAQRGIEFIRAPFAASPDEFLTGTDHRFEVVVMSRVYCGGRHFEVLRARWPEAKLIFHPGDLHFVREMREATINESVEGFKAALALKARELELARNADVTVVVSEYERTLLEDAGGRDIRLVEPEYTNRLPARYEPETRRGIAFIGGYRHIPNVDAVDWMMEQIWPLVSARRPDIPLMIVGSHVPESFNTYVANNVEVVGFVEDLDAFLDGIRLTIAPLRYGAGVKMKLISSLAAAVPVIGSSVATEGLSIAEGEGIVTCEKPKEFAEAIIALYDDAERLRGLSERGYAAVERRFSKAAVRGRYARETGIVSASAGALPSDPVRGDALRPAHLASDRPHNTETEQVRAGGRRR